MRRPDAEPVGGEWSQDLSADALLARLMNVNLEPAQHGRALDEYDRRRDFAAESRD